MLSKHIHTIRGFFREQDGSAAVEYALMVSAILGFCLASVLFLGDAVSDKIEAPNIAIKVAFSHDDRHDP
jgi:Flp pilus assembly pilin Flp